MRRRTLTVLITGVRAATTFVLVDETGQHVAFAGDGELLEDLQVACRVSRGEARTAAPSRP